MFEALRRPRSGVFLGFVLGVATAFCVLGPSFVLGVGPFWDYPPTDASSHVVGYRMYVQDAWRFPLFFTPTMDAPRGLNLLYMDALPLVALFAKALRGIVPSALHTAWFNPFGLWHATMYGLQGALGARLIRELVRRSVVVELTGAAFAIATPIFVFRVIHAALTAQFLVLAALLLYVLCARGLSRRRAACGWALLFAIATLVQPYLFAMCAPIFAAALITLVRARRWRDGIVIGVVPVVVVLGIVILAGFVGPEVAYGGMWGYGYKTTDLASFFVPQAGSLLPSPPASVRVDMLHAEASEGYAYLGAGVLVLVGIAIVLAPRTIERVVRAHWPLAVVLLLMTMFAVSHRITIAQKVAVEFPLPRFMDWPARQFRSCGRFVWPAVYAGSFFALAIAFRVVDKTRWALAVPLLALVQYADTTGAWAVVHAYTSRGEMRFLPWKSLEPLVRKHEGVTFFPSFECIPGGHPLDISEHMEVEYIAAKSGIRLSSMRSSRPLRDCKRDALLLAEDPVRKDDLYLLYPPAGIPIQAAAFERHGMTCAWLGHGLACSTRLEGSLPEFARSSPSIAYSLGDMVAIGDPAATRYLGHGWSYPEGTHRWSLGEASFAYLRANVPIPSNAKIRIRSGGAILKSRPKMRMEVRVDGTILGNPEVYDVLTDNEFPVPPSLVGQTVVVFELRPSDSRPPAALGEGTDARPLGISVAELGLIP